MILDALEVHENRISLFTFFLFLYRNDGNFLNQITDAFQIFRAPFVDSGQCLLNSNVDAG